MARSADPQHRADLLERIVDYVEANGLADLSLRPLAAGVDSSPRVLLYFFGSKEALVSEIIAVARQRQRKTLESMPRNIMSYQDAFMHAWTAMTQPQHEPLLRLFFEIYGMALQQPQKFGEFLGGVVGDWLPFMSTGPLRDGYAPSDARAIATFILAAFRGFMLDVLTTGDRPRVARGVQMFILALDRIPEPKELPS